MQTLSHRDVASRPATCWDALENVGKEFNTYGSRVSKDSICNIEGR
jgi:hypothetical protein